MSALTFATAQLLRLLPRASLGRAAGRLADLAWPAEVGNRVVGAYARFYRVDFSECVAEGGFKSFDDFFTRRLKDGVRPMPEDPSIVVSPADGRVDAMGAVTDGGTWPVKGSPYSVADLVGSEAEAKRYQGGAACVVYLSPRDYHRVHAPVTGTIGRVASMPGDFYPVNAIGLRHVPQLFARNRRVAIGIDAPKESGLGRVTVVMVAAMIVGRITVTAMGGRDVPLGEHVMEPAPRIERGAELGMFHLGSTAVVLLEPAACESWLIGEGDVRYGQALCRARQRAAAPQASSSTRKRNGARAGRGAG
jgi:phosphatidylserine decarboxylase